MSTQVSGTTGTTVERPRAPDTDASVRGSEITLLGGLDHFGLLPRLVGKDRVDFGGAVRHRSGQFRQAKVVRAGVKRPVLLARAPRSCSVTSTRYLRVARSATRNDGGGRLQQRRLGRAETVRAWPNRLSAPDRFSSTVSGAAR